MIIENLLMKRNWVLGTGILLLVMSCGQTKKESKAVRTPETEKLYTNLFKVPEKGILFGHQDATLYGVGWKDEDNRSDVKSVCGDYPAVYGWEIGHLELGREDSLDSVGFRLIRKRIREAFERGGLNTISWHTNNPLTGGNTWDVSSREVVRSVLPGGEKHEFYRQWLDRVATFLNSLETEEHVKIPVLFRPYHEHTGSWFWWGQDLCTAEEYKALWKYTHDYFTQKGVDHVLYVYSSDVVSDSAAYFERYPGDEYVDILGFDCYHREAEAGVEQYAANLNRILSMLTQEGKRRNKPIVLSETGAEALPMPQWWTEVLWKNIQAYPIVYALVWRNAYDRDDHYFAPYPGQDSAEDFVAFYKEPRTLFQQEVKGLYK